MEAFNRNASLCRTEWAGTGEPWWGRGLQENALLMYPNWLGFIGSGRTSGLGPTSTKGVDALYSIHDGDDAKGLPAN